jgi:hypothetical protein
MQSAIRPISACDAKPVSSERKMMRFKKSELPDVPVRQHSIPLAQLI